MPGFSNQPATKTTTTTKPANTMPVLRDIGWVSRGIALPSDEELKKLAAQQQQQQQGKSRRRKGRKSRSTRRRRSNK